MHRPARLGLLISGSGRTALNILDACERGHLDAGVALVVAHREEVEGVARCRARGLRVAVVPTGPNLEDRIDACLEASSVDLVCLAGYLRRFRVDSRWTGRALNIHPSLLPRFGGAGMYGLRVHAAVLASGEPETGCTVHFADEEYDRGAIVATRRCAVEAGDTPETLAARVFREECVAYPEAIAAVLSRRPSEVDARAEAAR
jgi:formyltetrahydrofolate-dependent phosphoribosylglycinamide formyltransferase